MDPRPPASRALFLLHLPPHKRSLNIQAPPFPYLLYLPTQLPASTLQAKVVPGKEGVRGWGRQVFRGQSTPCWLARSPCPSPSSCDLQLWWLGRAGFFDLGAWPPPPGAPLTSIIPIRQPSQSWIQASKPPEWGEEEVESCAHPPPPRQLLADKTQVSSSSAWVPASRAVKGTPVGHPGPNP